MTTSSVEPSVEETTEFLEWAEANVLGTNVKTYTIKNRAYLAEAKEVGLDA